MPYDTEPTAEYIQRFSDRQRSEWGPQTGLDDDIYAVYLRMEKMDTKMNTRDVGLEVKGIRAGFAGVAIDRDAATIAGSIGLTVKPRSSDPDDRKHADMLLEPWLSGCWDQSQVGDVIGPQVRDLALFARGVSNFYPLPRLWADASEFKALLDTYVELVSKDDPDEQAIKEIKKEIAYFKACNFPLRWRYVSARIWLPQMSDER